MKRSIVLTLAMLALAGCGSFARQSEVDQIAAERDNLQNEVEQIKSAEMDLAQRLKTVEAAQKYQLEAAPAKVTASMIIDAPGAAPTTIAYSSLAQCEAAKQSLLAQRGTGIRLTPPPTAYCIPG